MILLTSTSDVLSVVTDAVADVEVHASWVDHLAGVVTPGRTNTASITSAATTTIVGSPAASTQRNVRGLSLHNNSSSVTVLVVIQHYDGAYTLTLVSASLAPAESLVFDDSGRWTKYAADKSETPLSIAAASRSQMETGTNVEYAVTPGRQHYHPGHPKCWVKCNYNGSTMAAYNIASVTDTSVGQCAPQIATDFTSASWCCQAMVERGEKVEYMTNLKFINIRNGLQAAGSVGLECYDGVIPTHAQDDPNFWHMFGLGTLV